MKQRIRVTAICKRDGYILLLKRAGGRVEGVTNFELPTGKIEFGEQPDEAMARAIYEYLGVQTEKLQLADVITFTDLEGASELGNLYIIYSVELGEETIQMNSERYGAYKWVAQNDAQSMVLDEATRMVLQITAEKTIGVAAPVIKISVQDTGADSYGYEDENGAVDKNSVQNGENVAQNTAGVDGENKNSAQSAARNDGRAGHNDVRAGRNAKRMVHASDGFAIIYTDGGSRGNPGPSGAGYYIIGADGREIKRGGVFLGFSTSRLAEYYALKEGLQQAINLGLRKVKFRSDSLMLVNQMNGVYPVKNQDLMQVYEDVWGLLGKLDSYSFMHVPREQNREADEEVNKIIDLHLERD